MTEQQRKAVDILNRLRETHINRITEFVVENEDEMMEQAQGETGFFNTEELGEMAEKLRQLMLILEGYRSAVQEEQPPQQVTAPEVTFPLWAELVRAGEWERATYALAYLFQCHVPLAAACMDWFCKCLDSGQPMFSRVLELREAVNKEPGIAIRLLHECFGLAGEPAVHVLHSLQGTA